jgi:2-oxoglutarate ferredoxin oxidoreductase subunit beta
MTGGQMAPTTLMGMKSTTSPNGRELTNGGYPLDMSKLLAQLDGVCYVTRQSVHTVATVRKTKKAIRKALENSMMNKGTSVVEVVSTCSSGWRMTPAESNTWMVDNMFPVFPMGDLKDI